MTTNEETRAIATIDHEYRGLEMAVAPAEANRRLQQLQAFVQSVMVQDLDYGVIPGTGDKPTLLQPGAQKLAELYGFSHRWIPVESVKDWERGFFYFEFRCELTSRRDGAFVGEGIGSCNSRESKYSGRWVGASEIPGDKSAYQKRTGARWVYASDLPPGIDKRTLKAQQRTSKKGGQYAVYQLVDEQYLLPNPDPYSLVNTMQKMAAKRAYIHAVIAATRSASVFTQDVEDLPPEAFGSVDHDPHTGEITNVAPVSPDPPGASAAGRPVPPKSAPREGPQTDLLQFAKREQELRDVSEQSELTALLRAIAVDCRNGAVTVEQQLALRELAKATKARLESRKRMSEAAATSAAFEEGGYQSDADEGPAT
jgi:hypothetical protein